MVIEKLLYPSRMDGVLEKAAVKRFIAAACDLGVQGQVTILADTARTAVDAANGLGIEVDQIASSLIFKLPSGNPLLIITSGRHRVDTDLVAKNLGIAELGRADANYVKEVSGYSVGGVAPLGWINKPEMTLIDQALNDYEVAWAASGHPHAVYPTSFAELIKCTGATPMVVGD